MNLGAGDGRGPLLQVLSKGQAKLGRDVKWRRLTDGSKKEEAPHGEAWGSLRSQTALPPLKL